MLKMNGILISKMRLLIVWVLTITSFVSGRDPGPLLNNRLYHPCRIIIKPKPDVDVSQLEIFHAQNNVRLHKRFNELGDIQTVVIPATKNVENVIASYKMSGLVEFAEPDYLIHLAQITPNDPIYLNGSQWNLNNTGQFGGVPDADIDAPEGWRIQNSASNIIIAIIDSGIRYTHEDLKASMWKNPGEIPANGIDDDNNGYIDDIYGINAVDGAVNSGDPFDDYGHGTHVAGIIGASANNGKGIAGIAWSVQLMALKFIDSSNNGYLSDAVECINYAIKKGAKIINTSWGSTNYSATLQSAINSAKNAGIIFVASAGNESRNNDVTPTYPASYNLDNIISVAATDLTDSLANYSNYGYTSVDVAAPGTSIYSTFFINDSYYLYLSGTSMAAPHVSGICALAWARFPVQNYRQIIKRVIEGVDRIPSLDGKCNTSGRVNLYKVLSNYQIVYTNYAWINTNGMFQLILSDNGISHPIPLPFNFKFFGYIKTSIFVGANGLLGFTTNGMEKTSNTTLANTNTPNDAIYVYWDDLNPSSKGTIHYGIVGNAPERRFVVTWSGVPRKSANNVTLTFQAVLEEKTHSIVCQYMQTQSTRLISGGGATSATIGIENSDGTVGAEFLVNGDPLILTNNTAIVFIPYLDEGMVVGPDNDLVSTGPRGGPFNPSQHIYYITNTGNVSLDWRVHTLSDWISIYPSNGTLNGFEFTNVIMTINSTAQSMPVGSYIGDLLFYNLTTGGSSIRRSVVLIVNGTNAVLNVSPSEDFDSTGFAGGPFLPQSAVYTLLNTGDAPLEWRAEFSDEWLSVSPVNGFLSPMQRSCIVIEITTNAFSLKPGNYTEIVRIRNMTTGVGTFEILVNLIVKEPAGMLKILPDVPFESVGIPGKGFNPSSATYIFTNAGNGSLSWSITNYPSWISVSPETGALSPGETNLFNIAISSNIANLPVGEYLSNITLIVTDGVTERLIIPVILRIYSEPAFLTLSSNSSEFYYLETLEGIISGISNININICNTGGSNLLWAGEVSEDWFSLSIDSGILLPSEMQTIVLLPEYELIKNLPWGTYTNNVRLINQMNPGNAVHITILLKIRRSPSMHIHKVDDGWVTIIVQGETNQDYIIEKSHNLLRWSSVETNQTSHAGLFYFTNSISSSNTFYRARLK